MATAKKKAAKKKTTAKKKTAKKPTAKKPTAKKTTKAETKPAAKKKAAKAKPAAKKQTATKPAATSQPSSDVAALLRVRDQLRAHAFAMPGAWEDHPWGESVAKVGKKVFVFFGTADPAQLHKGIGMSVKLPGSGDLVLALPFAEPTGYGLGRAGWVSVYLQPADLPPMPMLTAWIDESYRAVAPKKQVAELDARGSSREGAR
jgi:predicted DNA-binding protein (MmcQ/YjbR family)